MSELFERWLNRLEGKTGRLFGGVSSALVSLKHFQNNRVARDVMAVAESLANTTTNDHFLLVRLA